MSMSYQRHKTAVSDRQQKQLDSWLVETTRWRWVNIQESSIPVYVSLIP